MDRRLDTLPWRLINDYLFQIGSAKSRGEFLDVALNALLPLVPFDTEGGLFDGRGPCLECAGATEKRLREYTEYYQFRLPFGEGARGAVLPPHLQGVAVTNWHTEYADSEIATDFMVPGGIRTTLTSPLPRSAYLFALHRSPLAPSFSETELEIMRVITAHVRNFLALWSRADEPGPGTPSAEAVADLAPKLSTREAEIASLLCAGLAVCEIATKLLISRRTVDAHVAHIFDKLDVHKRGELKNVIMGLYRREMRSGNPTIS